MFGDCFKHSLANTTCSKFKCPQWISIHAVILPRCNLKRQKEAVSNILKCISFWILGGCNNNLLKDSSKGSYYCHWIASNWSLLLHHNIWSKLVIDTYIVSIVVWSCHWSWVYGPHIPWVLVLSQLYDHHYWFQYRLLKRCWRFLVHEIKTAK